MVIVPEPPRRTIAQPESLTRHETYDVEKSRAEELYPFPDPVASAALQSPSEPDLRAAAENAFDLGLLEPTIPTVPALLEMAVDIGLEYGLPWLSL
jgi:hypothetical protein